MTVQTRIQPRVVVKRTIARKSYQNGHWGVQTASIEYSPSPYRVDCPWTVRAWDLWAHRTLAEAKAHYRSIGA